MFWKLLALLIFLCPLAWGHQQDASAMIDAVNRDKNNDVHLIHVDSDYFSKSLAKKLQDLGTPLAQSTAEFLADTMMMRTDEKCPIYFASSEQPSETERLEQQGLKRRRFSAHEKYLSLYVILGFDEDKIQLALSAMNKSIWNCTNQIIDLGVYHTESKIILIAKSEELSRIVFKDSRVLAHPSVAAAVPIDEAKWAIFNKPFYLDQPVLSTVWNGYDVTSTNNFYPNLGNMQEHLLRVSVLPYDRDILKRDDGTFWGVAPTLLGMYLNSRNARVQYNSAAQSFGRLTAEGWVGQLGQVYRNDVDFSITVFPNHFAFPMIFGSSLHLFYADGMSLVTPLPSDLPKFLAITYPFHSLVWLAILITFIVAAISFWALNWLQKLNNEQKNVTFFDNIDNTIWFCLGTLLGEAVSNQFHTKFNLTFKILVGNWVIITMIILAAYGGSIKSFLINPGQQESIDSLQDLLNQDKYGWKSYSLSAASEETWTKHPNPVVREAFERMEKLEYVYNFEKIHLKSVVDGKYALISIHSSLDFQMKTLFSTPNTAHFVPLPEMRNFMNLWLSHKLNPFNHDMSIFMRALNDYGLVDETMIRVDRMIKMENILSQDSAQSARIEQVIALSLDDLQGVFYVSALLLIMAMLIMAVEVLVGRKD